MQGSPWNQRRFGDRCRAIRKQLLAQASAGCRAKWSVESHLDNIVIVEGGHNCGNVDECKFGRETILGVVWRQPSDACYFSGSV